MLNPAQPLSHYYVAKVMNEKGQPDSAAAHYEKAAAAAANTTDTSMVKERNQAAFNAGAIYLNSKKYRRPSPAFEQYLEWVPNDVEVKRASPARIAAPARPTRRRPSRRSWSPPARPRARGCGGHPGPDDGRREPVQRQEVRRGRQGVRAGGGRSEPYNRDALYGLANTYLAPEGRRQAAADGGEPGGDRAAERDRGEAGRARATSRTTRWTTRSRWPSRCWRCRWM